jgi:hypothetical protein
MRSRTVPATSSIGNVRVDAVLVAQVDAARSGVAAAIWTTT